jgi:hypothetical protein
MCISRPPPLSPPPPPALQWSGKQVLLPPPSIPDLTPAVSSKSASSLVWRNNCRFKTGFETPPPPAHERDEENGTDDEVAAPSSSSFVLMRRRSVTSSSADHGDKDCGDPEGLSLWTDLSHRGSPGMNNKVVAQAKFPPAFHTRANDESFSFISRAQVHHATSSSTRSILLPLAVDNNDDDEQEVDDCSEDGDGDGDDHNDYSVSRRSPPPRQFLLSFRRATQLPHELKTCC